MKNLILVEGYHCRVQWNPHLKTYAGSVDELPTVKAFSETRQGAFDKLKEKVEGLVASGATLPPPYKQY